MSLTTDVTALVAAADAYGTAVKDRTHANRPLVNAMRNLKGVKGQTILVGTSDVPMALVAGDSVRSVTFVTSDAELAQAQSQTQSFAEVFSQWLRFSHNNTVNQPALPAELDGWQLTDGKLFCTINSASLIGFVSPESFSNYVFEVQVSSNNADDDFIGVVFGFYTDETGRQHTLTIGRTPGSTVGGLPKLFNVVYDFNRSTRIILSSTNGGLQWGDGVVDDSRAMSGSTAYGGWSAQGAGCRIKVTRTGDTFTFETTDMHYVEGNPYVATATLTLDLNSRPELAPFKGASPIGYAALSQANSTWDVVQRPLSYADFVDARNGNIYHWNTGSSAWEIIGTLSGAELSIQRRRFYYSALNGKLFYVNEFGGVRAVT